MGRELRLLWEGGVRGTLGHGRVCASPLCVCDLSLQLQILALPTLDWGPPSSDRNSAAASLPPQSGLSSGLAPAPSPVGEGPAATRVMPGWLRARPLVPLACAGAFPLPLVGVWGPGSWVLGQEPGDGRVELFQLLGTFLVPLVALRGSKQLSGAPG